MGKLGGKVRRAYEGLLPRPGLSDYLKAKRRDALRIFGSRGALIFKTSRYVYFESQSMNSHAYADPEPWFKFLPPEAGEEARGAALYTALRQSRDVRPEGVSDATRFAEMDRQKRLQEERLTAGYGVKTKWIAFRRMMLCTARWQDGVINILPSHHVRGSLWRSIQGNPSVDISELATDTMIGAALNRAFDQCIDTGV